MIHVLANFFSATFSIFYRKGILTTIVRKGAQEEERKRRSTLEGLGNDDIIVSWWPGSGGVMFHEALLLRAQT